MRGKLEMHNDDPYDSSSNGAVRFGMGSNWSQLLLPTG